MTYRFRPLPTWPHPVTRDRRSRSTFKASWRNTLELLTHELAMLEAEVGTLILGAGFREEDLRLDGLPRANAKDPLHPGIELSFSTPRSPTGRLVYATDVCERWEHNVRSIALGLEALRAVDRYGITRRGEQYAGFRELTAGDAAPVSRGMELVRQHGSVADALKATHPDHGGDPDDFRAVQAYRESLASTY